MLGKKSLTKCVIIAQTKLYENKGAQENVAYFCNDAVIRSYIRLTRPRCTQEMYVIFVYKLSHYNFLKSIKLQAIFKEKERQKKEGDKNKVRCIKSPWKH